MKLQSTPKPVRFRISSGEQEHSSLESLLSCFNYDDLKSLKSQLIQWLERQGAKGNEIAGQLENCDTMPTFEDTIKLFYGHDVETMIKSWCETKSRNLRFINLEMIKCSQNLLSIVYRNKEAIFDLRTISENIFAGNAAKGKMFAYLPAKTVRKVSEDAVDKYNIKIGKLKDPASSLSGGNQQKLVVARWIAMKPNLLLLDDPTKGVDIHSRQEIHEILRECAANGMTVIISASDTEELMDISDRIYVFYEGRIAAELSGSNKTPEHLVSAMMGVTGSDDGKEAGQ